MYITSLMEVNADIIIILWKLIINVTTFMFSLCIFIIYISSCVEIILAFQKFVVGACVLIVLNVMFNRYVFFLTENMKITIINVKCKLLWNRCHCFIVGRKECGNIVSLYCKIKQHASLFFILTATTRVISKHHPINAICQQRIEPGTLQFWVNH